MILAVNIIGALLLAGVATLALLEATGRRP